MDIGGFWELYGEWVIVVLTFLAGLVVTGGRPAPTLIKFIQWIKVKLNLGGNSAAAVKWLFATGLAVLFMLINGDLILDLGVLSPPALLALLYLFQENLHNWYEKLTVAGTLRQQ